MAGDYVSLFDFEKRRMKEAISEMKGRIQELYPADMVLLNNLQELESNFKSLCDRYADDWK
jgi:predicted nuclease with TOPRIM domain